MNIGRIAVAVAIEDVGLSKRVSPLAGQRDLALFHVYTSAIIFFLKYAKSFAQPIRMPSGTDAMNHSVFNIVRYICTTLTHC